MLSLERIHVISVEENLKKDLFFYLRFADFSAKQAFRVLTYSSLTMHRIQMQFQDQFQIFNKYQYFPKKSSVNWRSSS